MEMLKKIAKESRSAVIVVTHDIRMIEGFDRVFQIKDGRIVSKRPDPAPARSRAISPDRPILAGDANSYDHRGSALRVRKRPWRGFRTWEKPADGRKLLRLLGV